MVMHDNTYSRVVAWLKILLPLLALALLSTLFLVARAVDPAQQLPFADVDIDDLADRQRIGGPNYSSVTEDGAAISVSAESAQPDPEDAEKLNGLVVRAEIALPAGPVVKISSASMQLNHVTGLATLNDGVKIDTSDGYEMRTRTLEVALDATRVASDSKVQVTGPVGRISADSFALVKGPETDAAYVLVFKGHVKLIYGANK